MWQPANSRVFLQDCDQQEQQPARRRALRHHNSKEDMLFRDSVPSHRPPAFSIRTYTILFCAAFSAPRGGCRCDPHTVYECRQCIMDTVDMILSAGSAQCRVLPVLPGYSSLAFAAHTLGKPQRPFRCIPGTGSMIWPKAPALSRLGANDPQLHTSAHALDPIKCDPPRTKRRMAVAPRPESKTMASGLRIALPHPLRCETTAFVHATV